MTTTPTSMMSKGKDKHNGGYTEGDICRICKKPNSYKLDGNFHAETVHPSPSLRVSMYSKPTPKTTMSKPTPPAKGEWEIIEKENVKQYTMLVLDDMEHWNKGDWFWTTTKDEKEAWELLDKRWHKAFETLIILPLRFTRSQAYKEGRREAIEEIKGIDLNPEGRHMTIGELHGDLIDALTGKEEDDTL